MTELKKNTQVPQCDKTAVSSSNIDCENVYTDKKIRNWWLIKTEEDRRVLVRSYFYEGNSENINTLYGIMPEELEEIYLKNTVEMTPKEKLFKTMDRIDELKKSHIELSEAEQIELRHLEVIKMEQWSDWKD